MLGSSGENQTKISPNSTTISVSNLRGLQDNPNSRFASNSGHLPLHIKLQPETRYTAIQRPNISLPEILTWIQPKDVEKSKTGWSAHPPKFLLDEQTP
ncbi:hypothetical protein AVEN_179702-1 [Araneus ventricosus]|uniref:Uncharacterized protein n=1 Tax=Araneus ventricosus TaxID=182803 RepID=A0A4Y2LVN3_ARAVE|nr:hypothetical protein AVEN_179702-1 [Araneus ventricosus]